MQQEQWKLLQDIQSNKEKDRKEETIKQEEVKWLKEYQKCVVIYNDVLDCNQKIMDPFLGNRFENIDAYFF